MASDTVKKVQEKLFRGAPGVSQAQPSSERDPGLTINIPKPASSPAPPPKVPKAADTSPRNIDGLPEQIPYRERLAAKLGAEYNGVERHRLIQDANKQRHWKRWGPYLSDRQWVRAFPVCGSPSNQNICVLGNCS